MTVTWRCAEVSSEEINKTGPPPKKKPSHIAITNFSQLYNYVKCLELYRFEPYIGILLSDIPTVCQPTLLGIKHC